MSDRQRNLMLKKENKKADFSKQNRFWKTAKPEDEPSRKQTKKESIENKHKAY